MTGDLPEPPAEAEESTARPGATFFTILFSIAMFVNMGWDAISTDYNGVQNSLILAALAVSPPGVAVGKNLFGRLLEKLIGSRS